MRVLISLFLISCLATASISASVEEAMRLYSAGRKLEARRLLEQIVKTQPANFEAHFRLGLLALDSHDLPAATASLSRASQLQPSNAQVWLALAQIYQNSNQAKLSAEAAAKAEALAPEDPVVLHGLAVIHSEGGHWAKAATLEARYAAQTPEDREAVVRAVTWHLQARQPKPAIQMASRALAKEKRADLHNLLGKAYEADGQFDKTIIELQEAIKLSPRQESFYFDLAYVLSCRTSIRRPASSRATGNGWMTLAFNSQPVRRSLSISANRPERVRPTPGRLQRTRVSLLWAQGQIATGGCPMAPMLFFRSSCCWRPSQK